MQGNDPSTDLRGVGFLGLVQPLYLVSASAKTLQLAKDIYHLSQNETQEFPLMVLSINVTRIAVCALRDSLLARYVPTFFFQRMYYTQPLFLNNSHWKLFESAAAAVFLTQCY